MAVTAPVNPNSLPSPIRLPRPLSIGAVAVVVCIVAAGLRFGLPIYRQQVAIREIERLGGRITTEPVGPDSVRRWIGDSAMKPFDRPVAVDLADTPLTDDGLQLVGQLTTLEDINLYGTSVTDAGLQHLTGLTHLWALSLNQTRIGDAGLASLKGMNNLRYLNVEACPITDEGVGHIAEVSSLTWLVMGHTRMTDLGLARLTSLRKLNTLAVNRTGVTDTGIEALRRALPNLLRVDE